MSDPKFWSDAKRFKSLVAEGKKIDQFLGHLIVILFKIFDLKKTISTKKVLFAPWLPTALPSIVLRPLRLDFLEVCPHLGNKVLRLVQVFRTKQDIRLVTTSSFFVTLSKRFYISRLLSLWSSVSFSFLPTVSLTLCLSRLSVSHSLFLFLQGVSLFFLMFVFLFCFFTVIFSEYFSSYPLSLSDSSLSFSLSLPPSFSLSLPPSFS